MESTSNQVTELSESIVYSNQSNTETIQQNPNNINSDEKIIIENGCIFFAVKVFIAESILSLIFFIFVLETDKTLFFVFLIPVSFRLFFVLYFSIKKIEIEKLNNTVNVNIKNYFSCNKIKINGNIHFHFESEDLDEFSNNYFIILNDIQLK